jgi:Leucine-rich repeat (LRR) protein
MSSQQPSPVTTYIRFADWCLNFDSLSEEAKHTVELLLEIAGTSDCYEAEKILLNLTYLCLNNNQISDLTPLQSLTNLEYLELENNQIPDLTILQSLWKAIVNSTERVDRTRAAAKFIRSQSFARIEYKTKQNIIASEFDRPAHFPNENY